MKRYLLALCILVVWYGPVRADQPVNTTALNVPTFSQPMAKVDPDSLREELVNGLRATRDDQKNFIDHIVTMVDEGKLPVSLVYASFRWARKRRSDYPFPYFKYAVRELAKRKRILI